MKTVEQNVLLIGSFLRVGKLRCRAGFLESLEGGGEEEVGYRDQVGEGEHEARPVWSGEDREAERGFPLLWWRRGGHSQASGQGRQTKQVDNTGFPLFDGFVCLRQEVGLFTGVVEALPARVRPRVQIGQAAGLYRCLYVFIYLCLYETSEGKLDPKNVFDNNTEDKENDRRSSVVIGKINAKNLFENSFEDKAEAQKSSIQVGKINTKDIFADATETKSAAKIDIKVGKLKIKEEELFEAKDDCVDKTVMKVGKLNAKELFNSSPTEDNVEAAKFYKPMVQPKKLKVAELFCPGQENDPRYRHSAF